MPTQDRAIAQFPHCDQFVLHAPGECEYCDDHPDWQELRSLWGINFTGHSDPNKHPCPAEVRRPASTINKWHGNSARPKDEPQDRYQRLLNEEMDRVEGEDEK